jgi:hypothetical protein
MAKTLKITLIYSQNNTSKIKRGKIMTSENYFTAQELEEMLSESSHTYKAAAAKASKHDASSYAVTGMAGAGEDKGAELHTAAAKAAKESGAHKDVVDHHLAKAAAYKKGDVGKLEDLDSKHMDKGLLDVDDDLNATYKFKGN